MQEALHDYHSLFFNDLPCASEQNSTTTVHKSKTRHHHGTPCTKALQMTYLGATPGGSNTHICPDCFIRPA